jgi:hypothetical protein
MKPIQKPAPAAAAMPDRPVRHPLRQAASVLLAASAASVCASALAAGGAGVPDAKKRYEQERAACLSGVSRQERTACLREAAAAYAQARRGALDDGAAAAQYQRNALQRCERLPDEDRRACIARMQGQGTTSGSVEGGGIYRELVTREVSPPASGASAPRR